MSDSTLITLNEGKRKQFSYAGNISLSENVFNYVPAEPDEEPRADSPKFSLEGFSLPREEPNVFDYVPAKSNEEPNAETPNLSLQGFSFARKRPNLLHYPPADSIEEPEVGSRHCSPDVFTETKEDATLPSDYGEETDEDDPLPNPSNAPSPKQDFTNLLASLGETVTMEGSSQSSTISASTTESPGITRRRISIIPNRLLAKQRERTPTPDSDSWQVEYLEDEDDEPPEKRLFADDDEDPDVMTIEAFADLLDLLLEDPWSVTRSRKGLHICHLKFDNVVSPYVSHGFFVGFNGLVEVTALGRILYQTNPFFSKIRVSPTTPNGLLKITYVLELANLLTQYTVCQGLSSITMGKMNACEKDHNNPPGKRTYRSKICQLIVPKGVSRCLACRRLHQISSEPRPITVNKEVTPPKPRISVPPVIPPAPKPIKRSVDFEAIYKRIETQFTKLNKEEDEDTIDRMPTTQEEVLRSMGLTPTNGLDKEVRRSKRERKSRSTQVEKPSERKFEVMFLMQHWKDVVSLFSFDARIAGDMKSLRECCSTIHNILDTWNSMGGDFVCKDISRVMLFDMPNQAFTLMTPREMKSYIAKFDEYVNCMRENVKKSYPYFCRLFREFSGKANVKDD